MCKLCGVDFSEALPHFALFVHGIITPSLLRKSMTCDNDNSLKQFCQNKLKSLSYPSQLKPDLNTLDQFVNLECKPPIHRRIVHRLGPTVLLISLTGVPSNIFSNTCCCIFHKYQRRGGIHSGKTEQVCLH